MARATNDVREVNFLFNPGINKNGKEPFIGDIKRVQPEDFTRFDYMIAMDRSNLSHLQTYLEGVGGESALYLLREFDREGGPGAEVPDPYYGGPAGFEHVLNILADAFGNLLTERRLGDTVTAEATT